MQPNLLLSKLPAINAAVCLHPDGTLVPHPEADLPRVVFPGSFNPLHVGHRQLAHVVERRVGVAVHFELSIANVDKPELSDDETSRRVQQFAAFAPLWLTRAPTFAQKAELFPGTVFVLGWDTAIRIIDPKYYGHEESRRDAALRKLLDLGCRLLVGGRIDASGQFREWETPDFALRFTELFERITEAEFRVDVSSTELRQAMS